MTPHTARSLVIGSTAAVVALAGLDAGVAGWAQRSWTRAAMVEDVPPSLRSLPAHVIAMVLLAALAVAVAVALTGAGNRVLAVVVLVATVAGPMTVIAAPVRASLITADDQNVQLWWHLVVGVPQLVIMLAATGWAVRHRRWAETGTPPLLNGSALTIVGIFAAVAVTGQILLLPNPGTSQNPGPGTTIGWALLGAGLALVVARSTRRSTPALALLAAVVVVAALMLAYYRPGGWPGVAGWEFHGMQSPIVLSPAGVIVFLAGPALALGLQARRRLSRLTLAHGLTGETSTLG